MRRSLGRHLPLHDAAERHAPHAHGAAAPGLGGGPLHRLVPVPPLALRVDVGARASRVPGAADVEADDGVTAAGEPGGPVPAVVVPALGDAGFDSGSTGGRGCTRRSPETPRARRDGRPPPPARPRRSSACAPGDPVSPRIPAAIRAGFVRSCHLPVVSSTLVRTRRLDRESTKSRLFPMPRWPWWSPGERSCRSRAKQAAGSPMKRIHYAIYVGLLTAMSATGEIPSFENDYGRAEIGKPWESMMVSQGLAGWHASEAPFTPSVWRREGDAIIDISGRLEDHGDCPSERGDS